LLDTIPPYVLATIAALLFAVSGQIQHMGVQRLDSRTGTMLSIGSSAALYWLSAPFLLHPDDLLHPAILIFAAVGLVRPALSINLATAGIRHLGPTLSMTLSATSPLFGSAFGILILGELLTWQIAIGTLAIIAAVLVLTRRSGGGPSQWPLWALALPIAAAMIRGCAHGFSKIGMTFIPDPYVAGLVGFSVSAVLTASLHVAKGNRTVIDHRSRGPYLFLLAGCLIGTAIFLFNTALMRGEVVSAVPIMGATPVFSMLLSILVFRRERLNLKIVVAVLLVVPAVVLIALSH